jgi:ATP-dependent DNA ligase
MLVTFPLAPMEARPARALPGGDNWQFEPKWDGFRCLVFRDGADVKLQSKAGQPLERYFPEIVAQIASMKTRRFVLDGELVVPVDGDLSFDDLLQRIHPAASRIARLAKERPAAFIVFDLLQEGAKTLIDTPLAARRARLEAFVAKENAKGLFLSPATRDREEAAAWLADARAAPLDAAGAALDGVIAKIADAPYASGSRDAMIKIKNHRTADCVVGGFRYASGKKVVGSLLLGLYDDGGLLHHVGFSSSFKANEKAALTKKIEAMRGGKGFTGRAPGGPSRWSTERSAEWVPLKPSLVVEVEYDHFSQGRFRHGTKVVRWRPDKAPKQCTMDQIR